MCGVYQLHDGDLLRLEWCSMCLFFKFSFKSSFKATQDKRAFFEHGNTSNTREVSHSKEWCFWRSILVFQMKNVADYTRSWLKCVVDIWTALVLFRTGYVESAPGRLVALLQFRLWFQPFHYTMSAMPQHCGLYHDMCVLYRGYRWAWPRQCKHHDLLTLLDARPSIPACYAGVLHTSRQCRPYWWDDNETVDTSMFSQVGFRTCIPLADWRHTHPWCVRDHFNIIQIGCRPSLSWVSVQGPGYGSIRWGNNLG